MRSVEPVITTETGLKNGIENDAYLLLGSNVGARHDNLGQALRALAAQSGRIIAVSSVYRTAAWGKTDQDDFLNQVVLVRTTLSPQALLETVLQIEVSLGRQRTEKWGPRTLDVDILFFGDEVIHSESLIIPHPGIPNRRFTLVPLNEIAPGLVHPITGKTVKQLLEECPDTLPVHRADPPTGS